MFDFQPNSVWCELEKNATKPMLCNMISSFIMPEHGHL